MTREEAASPALPLRRGRDGVLLALRVTPRASREEARGLHEDAAGRIALKVAVRSPPKDGRANAAVIATLAKALDLPKSALSIEAGASGRSKTVRIAASFDDVAKALRGLIEDR